MGFRSCTFRSSQFSCLLATLSCLKLILCTYSLALWRRRSNIHILASVAGPIPSSFASTSSPSHFSVDRRSGTTLSSVVLTSIFTTSSPLSQASPFSIFLFPDFAYSFLCSCCKQSTPLLWIVGSIHILGKT